MKISLIAKFRRIKYWYFLISLWFPLLSLFVFSFAIRSFRLDYPVLILYTIVFIITILIFKIRLFNLKWETLLISVLFALLLVTYVMDSCSAFYTSYDLPQILEKGHLLQDIAFHVAIVESIKTFGYPSTLLHGNPFLSYHVGSHYLLAFLSFISRIPVIELFPYLYSFFALLFFTFLMTFLSTESKQGIFTVFIFSFTLFVSKFENFLAAFDISTSVALISAGILIYRLNHKRGSDIGDFILLIIAFTSKVSVGIYLFGLFGIFRFLTSNELASKRVLNLVTLLILFSILSYLFSSSIPGNGIKWEFDSLKEQFILQEGRNAKISLFFLVPSLLLLVSFYFRNYRISLSSLFILIVSFTAIHLSFINRAHLHFIVAANWISLFLFASLRFSQTKLLIRSLACVIMVVIVMIFSPVFREKIITNINIVNQFPQKTDANIYISKLQELRERNGKFLIEIPEQEIDFWHHWALAAPEHGRFFMAFWIPMLSGKPAYNGYNPKFMRNTNVAWYPSGAYGYSDYYNNCDYLSGFDNIIKIRKVGNRIIEEERKFR